MFKNKHFNAIVTKFLLVVTVIGLLLPPLGKISTVTAVITAACFTLAAYVLVDLVILSMYGNRLAVVADILLVMAMSWEIAMYIEHQSIPLAGLFLIGLLIGCGEWYYHKRYLIRLLYGGKLKP